MEIEGFSNAGKNSIISFFQNKLLLNVRTFDYFSIFTIVIGVIMLFIGAWAAKWSVLTFKKYLLFLLLAVLTISIYSAVVLTSTGIIQSSSLNGFMSIQALALSGLLLAVASVMFFLIAVFYCFKLLFKDSAKLCPECQTWSAISSENCSKCGNVLSHANRAEQGQGIDEKVKYENCQGASRENKAAIKASDTSTDKSEIADKVKYSTVVPDKEKVINQSKNKQTKNKRELGKKILFFCGFAAVVLGIYFSAFLYLNHQIRIQIANGDNAASKGDLSAAIIQYKETLSLAYYQRLFPFESMKKSQEYAYNAMQSSQFKMHLNNAMELTASKDWKSAMNSCKMALKYGKNDELDHLIIKLNSICLTCNGTGVCMQCNGTGVCPECKGNHSVRISCDKTRRVKCRRCDGTVKELRIVGIKVFTARCPECNGQGAYDEVCNRCKGDGYYYRLTCNYCGYSPGKCTKCSGSGKCRICYGSGKR